MAEPVALDRAWLAAHPLVAIPADTDKNARGRVLVVGGSRLSPGALVLTGEAALRAGAGKVRLATLASLAIPIGMTVPEAGVIALPEGEGGEIAGNALDRLGDELADSDTVVIGPGMADAKAAAPLLDAALRVMRGHQTLVIDAAAIPAAERLDRLKSAKARCILTPHGGEMARLLGIAKGAVESGLAGCVERALSASGQVVVLKSATTHVGSPAAGLLEYGGGGPGLATGGSGDVLAGIAAGLSACGQDPFVAAAWSVWLHGEAGARLAAEQGPIGYLARELLPLIPALRIIAG